MSRPVALRRIAALFLVIQALSYAVLHAACSPLMVNKTWIKGVLGPIAALEAVPRFRYHCWPANALFVAWCLVLLAAPFAYVVRPRRSTLLLSLAALVVWCLFGLGFSIDHM